MDFRMNLKKSSEIHHLLLFWLSYSIIQHGAIGDKLCCYVDFIETVMCIYESPIYSGDDALLELSATCSLRSPDYYDHEDDGGNVTECILCQSFISAGNLIDCYPNTSTKMFRLITYTCGMNMEGFSVVESIDVNIIQNKDGHHRQHKKFKLYEIFRPCPPFNLTVTISSGYNFSWNTKYESEVHYQRHDILQYELSYKKKKDSWENQKNVSTQIDRKNILLVQSALEGDTEYVSRVRAKPRVTAGYKGPWSDWSPLLTWTTERNDTEEIWSFHSWLPSLAIPLFLLVLLVFIYYHGPQKLWKEISVFTPNPAAFFSPLYEVHGGDFKSWLGASCTLRTMELFDWGVSVPDVVAVYSQHLPALETRMGEKEMQETQEQNTLLLDPGVQGQEHSRFHIPCRSDKSNLGAHSYGNLYISSEEAREIEESATYGHQLTPLNVGKNIGVGQNGGAVLDLANGHGLLIVDSLTLDNEFAHGSEVSDNSVEWGRPPTNESIEDPLMGFLEPDMSVLDLLYSQVDVWEDMASSVSDLAHEDNISYNEDCNDSFSPSSVTDSAFGYPRINLDLDTIDSGFADSDCGSPVECEFNKNIMASASSSFSSDSIGAGAEHPRNYMKQWVSDNSALSSVRS